MKKIFTVLIILVLLALLGFGLWYFLIGEPGDTKIHPFGDMLPFGSGEGLNIPSQFGLGETTNEDYGVESGRPARDLFRVIEAPVAGAVLLGQGASTTVRYVDRATGHIYDTNLVTLSTRKITNTTLPKIYEALFRTDGQKVLFRSLDEGDVVENLSITLRPPTATSTDALYTLNATVLRGDMTEVITGSNDNLFYVLKDNSSIVSSAFEGTGQRTIFTSPFTAWRLGLFGTSLIAWTKASANVPGYAYALNTTGGGVSKILGPFNGLTVLSDPLGGRVAYSYNQDNIRFFARNTQTRNSYEILPATLPEKCVWSRLERGTLFCGAPINGIGNNEPDNWYKGITYFSDRIWRFETEVDMAEIISEPKETYGVDLDVSILQLSIDENYLIFINRNDLSLWALKLD